VVLRPCGPPEKWLSLAILSAMLFAPSLWC
jgi:hypothetical protein